MLLSVTGQTPLKASPVCAEKPLRKLIIPIVKDRMYLFIVLIFPFAFIN
jgi:hypothetical protein